MKKKKRKVAIIFGGRSAEHEVSIISASSVYRNLDKKKFIPISIYIDKKGLWRKVSSPFSKKDFRQKGNSFLPWKSSMKERINADIYFPLLHGPYGEDGTIQGLLEMENVPYVGTGILGSALSMDKAKMKEIFRLKNLPVVDFEVIYDYQWSDKKDMILKILERFLFPVFVKPSNLGSSVGITKVKERENLESAIEYAFRWDRKILVEQGINAREIECSVLGNDNPISSIPGEVIPYREFYDYRDKYIEGKTKFEIPAKLSEEQIEEIKSLSILAYKSIECSGMARVDFLMDRENEKIYLSEVNTIPGFTSISMYPKLWEASGIPYSQLIERLIEYGFERFNKKKILCEY
ncbi:MAG: D-alanine--D-alanine ligase family protein [Acidobacteriota bacterium]